MSEKHYPDFVKQLRNRIQQTEQLNIVLGAGSIMHPLDWIPTNIEELDILCSEDWQYLFGDRKIDNVMCEHVWEHLTLEEAAIANRHVMKFLKHGGNFRIAVPDGYHTDPDYLNYVKPLGTGAGAEDHKVLYNYRSLQEELEKCGFLVEFLEHWDENGKFNRKDWGLSKGKIHRSIRFDERNENGSPIYTSLIIDAIKP